MSNQIEQRKEEAAPVTQDGRMRQALEKGLKQQRKTHADNFTIWDRLKRSNPISLEDLSESERKRLAQKWETMLADALWPQNAKHRKVLRERKELQKEENAHVTKQDDKPRRYNKRMPMHLLVGDSPWDVRRNP